MIRMSRGRAEIDVDAVVTDFERLDETSERVRLANYALAAPLVDVRQGQMEREVARVAARRGAGDPEVAARTAVLQNARARFGLFRGEMARTRVEPPVVAETASGISGIVVRGPAPVVDATVVAYANGERAGFTCTDEGGGFALGVPASAPVILSVLLKEGGEAYRDGAGVTLKPRQRIFRTIDLAGTKPPCAEPPDDPPPPTDDGFAMIELVGQTEAAARRLIDSQGLVLGDRKEVVNLDQVGRVVDQSPAAGAKVRRGDAVSIVVATDDRVPTPSVLGMTPEDARLALAKVDLTLGEVTRTPVEKEREGVVFNQTPLAGDRVPLKTAVDVEIGVAEAGSTEPRLDPKLARIAELAEKRLTDSGHAGDTGTPMADRLVAAKVRRMNDLDKLFDGERDAARTALGLRTLAETDRMLAALKQARKDLRD